jgi:hypothetical protein
MRILPALYCLSLMVPALPRPAVLPQQSVQTAHSVVCVHTRLTDEVEDWKIQRTLELVREMGASTIVEFLPWAYVESAPAIYDWARTDRIIGFAREQGLTVIARLGLVPDWARPRDVAQKTSLNSLTPDHYADYARYVRAFAERYRGKADRIIAWNEPNLSFEWGYRSVSPSEYVAFLETVYRAAHDGNPDVIVLGGALAPTLEAAGSANAWNDLDYLRGIYEAGGRPYFDALAVHTYGFTQSPEVAPAPDNLNFRRAELLHAIMVRYGDADKPVYVTESGWNDHPRWSYAVRPGERITYTLDAYRWAEQYWPWAKSICTWYFRAPTYTRSYPDYFAFVTPDFRERGIYQAVKSYALGDSKPAN